MNTTRLVALRAWIRAHAWWVAGAAGAATVTVVAIFAVIAFAGDDASPQDDGDGSEVAAATPPPVPDVAVEAGGVVPPLGPVIIGFREPPPEQDAALLVRIEPAVEGQYVWLNDRRLLFQPDYPGLQRGAQYAFVVDGPAAGLADDRRLAITVDGQLTVDNVIPADGDREVPTEAQVLVQFSRSVAPLTTLAGRSTAPVVAFDPPLAGEGEWLNTSLYRFVPTDTRPSTTYRLRVAAGLTSAADGRLEDDFTWSFSTIQPALASSFPAGGPQAEAPDFADTQFVSLRTEVVLTFNQPMDRAAVEAGVTVSADGSPVLGAFSWSAEGTVLTFVPEAQLAGGTIHTVRVPAGLAGAAGGTTRESRTITFRTFDLPHVEDTSPRDGDRSADRFGIYVQYNNPMNLESFEGLVTISGLTADEFEVPLLGESQGLYIDAPLLPSTAYTVSIAAGAQDRDGQIAPAHSFSFTTGARQPQLSLSIPSSTSTYAASTEPILYYFATNMDSATFTLHRVDEAQALSLIESYSADQFVPTGPPLRTWTVPLTDVRDTVALHSTSLSGDGEPLPRGHYFLTASNPDFPARVLFSVVDVTLVTKLSLDELLVWALDHDSGAPVRGLTVQASGPGISLPTSVTNASGIASFAIPGPIDPVFRNRQRAYVAHLVGGERSGVAHTEWRNGIFELGVPQDVSQRPFVGLVYPERPIYRPGETVFFKGVLRRDDDAAYSLPGANVAVDLVLRDARGDELLTQRVQPNEFGTFVGELELPEEASTGSYGIELTESSQGFANFITFASFIVAEFRTPEFSVEVRADGEHFVDGDEVPTTAAGTFFFGGPVSGAAVEWTAFGSPTSIRVEGFERYAFGDFDFFRSSGIDTLLRAEGEAETDASGEARFLVPAALQGREGAHQLQISATVIDQNDQAVASSTTVTIHPATYHAGIATESYVARAGEETTFQLVTVDIESELLAQRAVTVEVYQREWVTTKEQTSSGALYRSEPVDTLLRTLTATTGDDAQASVVYTPASTGTLRVVAIARDAQGREARAATFLWVSGSEEASWRIRNDDVIELIADRDVYEVGDTAEILVPAPFPGATALVTVERGKVITRRVVTFEGNSERIQVPILDGFVPNVFVGVVLYRPPTGGDPVPRYNVGYAELPVSTDTRKLIVTVEPRVERAVPGETVRYDVTVTDTRGRGQEAELSVAIVDAAVLSLAEQVGPDGLRAFWFERGLGVLTGSSVAVSVDRLNDVTREADVGRKGGGGTSLRENFRNTALWEGQLVTDADGTASFELVMPDNLTTWRAQAIAVSGDTMVGEGTSELLVTQPLLLRPALPRFLRIGDATTLRLLVRNGTTRATNMDVVMEAEGIDVEGLLERSATVAADSSVLLEWPATVHEEGTARVVFRASSSAGDSDAVATELPIHLDVTPETTATGGVVGDAPAVEAIFLPEFTLIDRGGLEVSVQASLVGALDDELAHFSPRSLEYVEPKASRMVATLGAARARGAAGEAVQQPQLRADIAFLIATQRSDGGWAWCRLCRTDMRVTAWALTALGEAQAAGADVDASVASRAANLVRRHIRREADVLDPVDPNQTAMLIYALAVAAQSGDLTSQDFLSREETTLRAIVRQDRALLTNWGRAYALLGLSAVDAAADENEVRTLLNDLTAATIASANGNHWEDEPVSGSMHNGNVRTTALVLQALTEIDLEHPLVEETVRWLAVARTAQGWSTNIERAQAITALGAFAGATGELAGAYDYSVLLGGEPLLAGSFTADAEVTVDRTEVPIDELARGSVTLLSLIRDFAGPGRMYYGLNLRYVIPAQEVEALNRGFAVSRQYSLIDAPGERVQSVPVGEVVRVRLTIVTPADRKFVVLEDFLPAGLEPIDPQLATVSPALKQELQAERAAAIAANAPEHAAPWFSWYFNPWDHVDVRDDRVTLYADELPKGVHEYVFFMRATSSGDYFVAPPHIEEAFFPEVFGRGDSERLTIESTPATTAATR